MKASYEDQNAKIVVHTEGTKEEIMDFWESLGLLEDDVGPYLLTQQLASPQDNPSWLADLFADNISPAQPAPMSEQTDKLYFDSVEEMLEYFRKNFGLGGA